MQTLSHFSSFITGKAVILCGIISIFAVVMKRIAHILLLITLAVLNAKAQDDAVWHRAPATPLTDTAAMLTPDTSTVSALMPRLFMPEPFYMSPWTLHEGFNAQLGMSVTMGFGKHAPKGVGIGSNAAFIYALPVGQRFAVAGGVLMHTLDWGGWKTRDASVVGIAAYRLNDFMNVYAFGEKSLTPKSQRGVPFRERGEDRWGGAVDFSLGNHVFIQFGVSQSRTTF